MNNKPLNPNAVEFVPKSNNDNQKKIQNPIQIENIVIKIIDLH
jgi:hypothetical protein